MNLIESSKCIARNSEAKEKIKGESHKKMEKYCFKAIKVRNEYIT